MIQTHSVFETNAPKLGLIRAVVFGIWAIIILNSPFTVYAELPQALYEPLGLYAWLLPADSYVVTELVLQSGFLLAFKLLLLAGCILCALGLRPFKALAIPTILLLLLADALVKSFNGFVNHAQLGILYGAIILAFSPAADGFTVKKSAYRILNPNSRNYALPAVLVASVLCIAYSFIGMHRLVYGGLEIFTGKALYNFLAVNTFTYSIYSFETGLFVLNSELLWIFFKAGFAVITLFEVFSPLTLFSRRFRAVWLWVIIPFHILSLFSMNIFFWENCLLILALFIKKDSRGSLFFNEYFSLALNKKCF